ncbi:hypothetical protein SDC9_96059 [bioreactor metagenome]|uniref:Glycosyltransferase subfamily 4-like N-terminal domain-containing protein n=1 Tax=bioreactor metagenome TaxID=1076179 RepID=A0A645A832_9ZZZZ
MKILVVCQYYYPEPFRITDICETLTQRGHEVTVITGTPNYPMGEIYDGYKNGQKSDEIVNGVKVHRCATVPRKKNSLHRFLNYLSYVFTSTKYIIGIKDEYDVVLVNQLSPVIMAVAGIKYKKKHNKKLVLYCLDLWPVSLITGGIQRGSLIYKTFHNISKRIYQQADRILITSKSFADYFRTEFGIYVTEYLPQYAEDLFSPKSCKKQPNEMLDLMFAGNLGIAQSVKTIVNAAKLTQEEKIHWHIVGDGTEYEDLKRQAFGLDNITFYGRQPLEKMPEYYSKADAMLVTMKKNPVISLTLPGKIQTYLAAGKPIIGAINGETKLIIEEARCGYCCQADNADELRACALKFLNDDRKEDYSFNSRAYYEREFSKSVIIDKLISVMERVRRA